MQDLYIILVNGSFIPEQFEVATDRGQAVDELLKQIDADAQDAIEVLKSNPSDNTSYFVTGDIAEAAFAKWDDRADQDEPMPYVFAKLNFEREPTCDNREHAEDYRAWAV